MVSVIVPNYNHSRFLPLRIDSILNQTYDRFEVIILDDKSTDNSSEIINRYAAHPKVSHIIFNDANSGSVFRQWQKGINLAKGQYIWIAESDDYADIRFLEKTMDAINRHNAILGFTQSDIVDENNSFMTEFGAMLKNEHCTTSQLLENNLLYFCNLYNASMIVFRKDAIKNVNWDKVLSYKLCGDWLLWAELAIQNNGYVTEIKEKLNFHRRHSSNTSSWTERNGLTFLEGLHISKMIAKKQNISINKEFAKKWFDKYQDYKVKHKIPKSVQFKIGKMFLSQCPYIAYLEMQRLISVLPKRLSKTFKQQPTVF